MNPIIKVSVEYDGAVEFQDSFESTEALQEKLYKVDLALEQIKAKYGDYKMEDNEVRV